MLLGGWAIALRVGGSLVPVLGGALAAVAFAIAPRDGLRGLWWLPLVADLGCVPLLVLTASDLGWRWLSQRRK
jgi:hypothetical protein